MLGILGWAAIFVRKNVSAPITAIAKKDEPATAQETERKAKVSAQVLDAAKSLASQSDSLRREVDGLLADLAA